MSSGLYTADPSEIEEWRRVIDKHAATVIGGGIGLGKKTKKRKRASGTTA